MDFHKIELNLKYLQNKTRNPAMGKNNHLLKGSLQNENTVLRVPLENTAENKYAVKQSLDNFLKFI